jgi:hypothetical protein
MMPARRRPTAQTRATNSAASSAVGIIGGHHRHVRPRLPGGPGSCGEGSALGGVVGRGLRLQRRRPGWRIRLGRPHPPYRSRPLLSPSRARRRRCDHGALGGSTGLGRRLHGAAPGHPCCRRPPDGEVRSCPAVHRVRRHRPQGARPRPRRARRLLPPSARDPVRGVRFLPRAIARQSALHNRGLTLRLECGVGLTVDHRVAEGGGPGSRPREAHRPHVPPRDLVAGASTPRRVGRRDPSKSLCLGSGVRCSRPSVYSPLW